MKIKERLHEGRGHHIMKIYFKGYPEDILPIKEKRKEILKDIAKSLNVSLSHLLETIITNVSYDEINDGNILGIVWGKRKMTLFCKVTYDETGELHLDITWNKKAIPEKQNKEIQEWFSYRTNYKKACDYVLYCFKYLKINGT